MKGKPSVETFKLEMLQIDIRRGRLGTELLSEGKGIGDQTSFYLDLGKFKNGIIKMQLSGVIGKCDYLCY